MGTLAYRLMAVALLLALVPRAQAEEFRLETYQFVGELADQGRVRLRIEKDPNGLRLVVSSAGGPLATVAIHPSKAAELGQVLMKAEDYYMRHQEYYREKKNSSTPLYREEYEEIVKVEDYQVVFRSAPRGEDFSVKFGPVKPFSPMVLMTKEEAVAVAGWLLKGEDLAEFVNRHVQL